MGREEFRRLTDPQGANGQKTTLISGSTGGGSKTLESKDYALWISSTGAASVDISVAPDSGTEAYSVKTVSFGSGGGTEVVEINYTAEWVGVEVSNANATVYLYER